MSKRYMPKPFVISGFALVISCYVLLGIAAVCDGHWSFSDTLSDLGVSKNLAARLVFNLGCIYTGILYLMYGYGKFHCDKKFNRLSGLCVMIAALCIMSISVLTKDPVGVTVADSTESMHMVMAGLYGGFSAAAMALSAIGDYREHKICTLITIILLAVCLVMAFLNNFPMFEMVSVSMIGIWVVVQCFKYIYVDLLTMNGTEA